MSDITNRAVQSCIDGEVTFTKFISANDAGKTGGHQAGFYVPVSYCPYIFEKEIIKDTDYTRFIEVRWQEDFITQSRFKYYGSKNECHFTRFQKGFPFLTDENVGNLLIVTKRNSENYEAFVLIADDDIEEFFNAFGISSTETNKILPKTTALTSEDMLKQLYQKFIEELAVDFPPTIALAEGARRLFCEAFGFEQDIVLKNPDKEILNWISTEFELFKAIENNRYGDLIKTTFPSVDELVKTANAILNRRKSRAGRSLEHHLCEIFNIWKLKYSSQPVTEANKKPDFIFPNINTYYSEPIGSDKLVFLGAKTTCKDRWRQIVGEADKIPHKFLFTLQQGISGNQMNEMKLAGVTLVVPKPYISKFPKEYQNSIWTLNTFVRYVAETQK